MTAPAVRGGTLLRVEVDPLMFVRGPDDARRTDEAPWAYIVLYTEVFRRFWRGRRENSEKRAIEVRRRSVTTIEGTTQAEADAALDAWCSRPNVVVLDEPQPKRPGA